MGSLAKKHLEFINNLFLFKMNGTDAYQATYPKATRESARREASRLLTKVDIQAEIKHRFEEMSVPADEVLARLGEQARVNIGDFFIIEPVTPQKEAGEAAPENSEKKEGGPGEKTLESGKENSQQQQLTIRLDYNKIKEMGHLVKSLTWTQYGPKLELHDSQVALLNIGKNHGLFGDRHIITLKVEKELEQFLDALERGLDPETYERVLAIISGEQAGQEEATAADPDQDD